VDVLIFAVVSYRPM